MFLIDNGKLLEALWHMTGDEAYKALSWNGLQQVLSFTCTFKDKRGCSEHTEFSGFERCLGAVPYS
jgi:hypothetical protein